jgi:hypothetical protein
MAKVIFGKRSSVLLSMQNRDAVYNFYCGVLDGKILKQLQTGSSCRSRTPYRYVIREGTDALSSAQIHQFGRAINVSLCLF